MSQLLPVSARIVCWALLTLIPGSYVAIAQENGAAKPPTVLRGHTAGINSVIYTPDQKYVVTASADKTIRIWDSATGKEIRTLSGHTGQVLSLVATPDSTSIVSGAADNSIRVWDLPKFDPLQTFVGHEGIVHSVEKSPNGQWTVSFGADKNGRVWNVEDGAVKFLLEGHTDEVLVSAVRADSNQISSGDKLGNIIAWKAVDGKPEVTIGGHTGPVSGLAYHPNNLQLVSTGEDGLVKVWQLPFVAPRTFEGHTTPVRSISLTSNGLTALSASEESVRLFTVASGQLLRELTGLERANATAISPNNSIAAAAGVDGSIKFWNVADGADRLRINGHDQSIASIVFHPDNLRIASGGSDGTVRIFKLPVAPVPIVGHTGDVVSVAINPQGQIATTSADKTVRLWNVATGQAVRTLAGNQEAVTCLAYKKDGTQIAVGDESGLLHFWNPADGVATVPIGAHSGKILKVAYHPAGNKVATLGDDSSLKIWNLPAPAQLSLAGNAETVSSVSITSDAKSIITGGTDKTIRVYDAATGQQTRVFADVPDAVTCLALSKDESITAVGFANGSIKLWNTADGTAWKPADGASESSVLIGHEAAVVAIEFNAESKGIVSASTDGTIRHWNLPKAPVVNKDQAVASTRMVVSPDRKLCAFATTIDAKPAIAIRNLADGKILHTLLGHEAAITALGFNLNGTKLASASADNNVRVWDLADPKFPEIQKVVHASPVTAVALNSDASQVFMVGADFAIVSAKVADGEPVLKMAGHTGAVSTLQVAGQTIVSGSADGTVKLWNLANGAVIRSINHAAPVTCVALSSDGATIASGAADNSIKTWTAATGAPIGSPAKATAPIVDLAFDTAGTQLASISGDVSIWDLAKQRRVESFVIAEPKPVGIGFTDDDIAIGSIAIGQADGSLQLRQSNLVQMIDAHAGGVSDIAIVPGTTNVVSCGADKSTKLWNLADGKTLATFSVTANQADLSSLVVTPDGKRLIGGAADKILRSWQLPVAAVAQGVAIQSQWELASPIQKLAISRDGNRLAISSEDNIVRIWDLVLEKELERFTGHTAGIARLAISNDGQLVASGSVDKTARLSRVSLAHVAQIENQHDLSYVGDGSSVITSGAGTLSIWKLAEDKLEIGRTIPPAKNSPENLSTTPIVAIAINEDNTKIASLNQEGTTHLWNMADGKLLLNIAPARKPAPPEPAAPDSQQATPAGGLDFSKDMAKLVIGQGAQVRVIDVADGRLLEQFDESAAVTSVAFADDNLTIIVGRAGPQDNAALRKTSLERLIAAHEGTVHGLAFSPDGNTIFSAGADKSIRAWNVVDGKLKATFAGCQDSVTGIAITGDAANLVASCLDKQVRIWPINPAGSAEPVQPKSTFPFAMPLRSISVSADNLKFAVCGDDGFVHVCDLVTGRPLQRFGEDKPLLDVAFAADNKTILSAGADNHVRASTFCNVRTFETPSAIRDMSLAAAGAQVVTAGDKGVHHWNLADGNLLREFSTAKSLSVDVRTDNLQLVATDSEQQLYFWTLASGELTTQLKTPAPVGCVRYSADNLKVAASCSDNFLRFYKPLDGTVAYELDCKTPPGQVCFASDDRTVFAGGAQLNRWLYASPDAVRTLNGHAGGVYGLTVSPDGEFIASASADQTVRIWNLLSGTQTKVLSGHVGAVFSTSFSPNGSLLVSSGADKSVRLWDTLGGRQLKQIPVGKGSLYTVGFFSDGKRVATAGLEREIYFVDVTTGEIQNTLTEHSDYLYRVAFNKTGTRMLSCGYGGNIILWNTANGQPVFTADTKKVTSFADLAPDGSRIVIAGGDGNAYFVDIPANQR